MISQTSIDELLAQRVHINDKQAQIIDVQTEPWGITVSVVEVKDVLLPDTMQRAMARQAEAEREKRAKVIHAEGEYQAAQTLAPAARVIRTEPAALTLRYLLPLPEVGGPHNHVLIPLPMDVMST